MDNHEEDNTNIYGKGEYVLYGANGVCRVEGITVPDLPGTPAGRKYYALHPVRDMNATIYTPVDNEAEMRRVMTREEAEELIRQIPEIDPLEIHVEKGVEEIYKESMRSFDRVQWIRLLKCIYGRKKRRSNQGKKTIAADEKFMKIAEEAFYSELSLVLEIPRDKVEDYVAGQIKRPENEK